MKEGREGEWPTTKSLEEVASEMLQAQAPEVSAPVPMEVQKGGCVIRDIRIW